MMAVMTEDRAKWQWAKLGAAIKAAREARGLTQVDLAERAGISEGSVQNLEKGGPRSRMPQSIAKVEPHLGWAAGSGLAILRGGDPALTTAMPDTSVDPKEAEGGRSRGLPLRIVDELESDDPLLDATVIRLPGTGDARMTIVVRGNPDATPQEIQEALLAWRKAERRLQRLPAGDDDGNKSRAANDS
jgi:transcriptional regulator with XRE-family HTH domain